MNADDFTRIRLVGERPRCGHGSHTGDQCARTAVARVAPKRALWMNRFRCEVHADDYMKTA